MVKQKPIIKELKLSLLIYNKIIIKEEILNNLIEIYNENNKNEIKMIFLYYPIFGL